MSRIGRNPVVVPAGVTATVDGQTVKMKGPKGELSFTCPEEIEGVGFRGALKGKDTLQRQIGFSHDVIHKIPPGVDVKVAGAKQEVIEVSGIDKQRVGQVAAEIRASRPPEPYQGKGIRYRGEYIHRKEGKKK